MLHCQRRGITPLFRLQPHKGLLQRAGLPTFVKLSAPQRRKLLAAMRLDKKVSGGEVKFVLAEKLGRVRFGCRVAPQGINGVI